MIIVKVSGGLGNQMFQYSVGRAVALEHNVELKIDITAYETYELHGGYRLKFFNIVGKIASSDEIKSLKGRGNVFCKLLKKAGFYKKTTVVFEKERTVFDLNVFKSANVYLDGYWQNAEYFSKIRSVLLKEFVLKSSLSLDASLILKQVGAVNSVSIHVRRGDYLKHPKIGVLDVEYYKKAVRSIINSVSNPRFFIFSNDIEWCKLELSFIKNCCFIEGLDSELEDLCIMTNCKHNIIANSSFSWWGAWLNNNQNKIVISPKKWMAVNPENHKWVPDEWKQL